MLPGGAFVVLTALVAAGGTRSVDRDLLAIAQSTPAPWLDLAASLVSLAGQFEVSAVVALGVAIAWTRHAGPRGLAPMLLFAMTAIELALKFSVAQPAPPQELSRGANLLPLVHVNTPYAYPSGHMARTAFLAALLARRLAWRVALSALVVLMAVTRLYLGEHWASDVAGGLLLGLAFGAPAAALGRENEPAHEGDRGPAPAD